VPFISSYTVDFTDTLLRSDALTFSRETAPARIARVENFEFPPWIPPPARYRGRLLAAVPNDQTQTFYHLAVQHCTMIALSHHRWMFSAEQGSRSRFLTNSIGGRCFARPELATDRGYLFWPAMGYRKDVSAHKRLHYIIALKLPGDCVCSSDH
jgi:hypothetical protein